MTARSRRVCVRSKQALYKQGGTGLADGLSLLSKLQTLSLG